MSAASRVVLAASVLVVTAVLCALGFWQLERLAWKQALIAKVAQRLKSAEIPLAAAETRFAAGEDIEYLPVQVSGTFDHTLELYFFTSMATPGWNVFTPLRLSNGRTLLVNRGFVPADRRDRATRPDSLPAGVQQISGLARQAPAQKPNSFVPDNEPQNRSFFWKSIGEMALAAQLEPDALVPFFVDAGPSPQPNALPAGGTTIISFPNNHLGYAFTWFGLAATCLGVGGFFWFSRRATTL